MTRPLKDVLYKLIFEDGFSVKEVAKRFGVYEKTVYNWLRYYKLPNPKYHKIKMTPELERKVVIDYLHLHGREWIARKHNMADNRAKRILERFGLDSSPLFSPHTVRKRMKDSYIPLSSITSQIIIGDLLGDGHIRCILSRSDNNSLDKVTSLSHLPTDSEYMNAIDNLYLILQINEFTDLPGTVLEFDVSRRILKTPHTSCFMREITILGSPWIEHTANLFRSQGYPCNTYPIKRVRDEKIYYGLALQTQGSLQLERERQQWYNGHKIVIRNLILTPLIVLFWYIGDGWLADILAFATHGFVESDVEFLADLLSREIGICVKKHPTINDCNQYFLQASRRDLPILLTYFRSDPAAKTSLSIAKRLFPWKFNNLRRKDVYDYSEKYVDNRYFKTYMRLLKQFMGKDYLLTAKKIFPWKFH